MIERYTRPEMGQKWSPEARFNALLEVEKVVAEVEADLGLIPRSAAAAIRARGSFDLRRMAEIEATTRHDVIAFVTNVAETVGSDGRYVHFGLTSSDVLDTGLSLQIREASAVVLDGLRRLEAALWQTVESNQQAICAGRTHGMHAEPTTFALKVAGHLAEMGRHRDRFLRAVEQAMVGKLSGAVGTYSALGPEVEAEVCRRLNLVPETIATQVVPRDRHAEVIWSLAMLGAGIERLALELRHLQRTEVGEVVEGFGHGQKGSSAMPHKKNPISCENLTGGARLLRAYADAALENIALWHERDISHSSVERVIFPDAFILADYMIDRLTQVLRNLVVHKERMRANMELSQGQLFSSQLLLLLVQKGLSREKAYGCVQRLSHSLQEKENLRDKVLNDKECRGLVSQEEVDAVFSGERHLKSVAAVLRRVMPAASVVAKDGEVGE